MKPLEKMNRDHKAILELLEERGKKGASTTEIVEAGFNGYRGRISELRLWFGFNVVCKYDGQTDDGRKKHRYYLGDYAPPSTEVIIKKGKLKVGDTVSFSINKSAPVVSKIVEKPTFGMNHCSTHQRNYEPGSRCPACMLSGA